MTFRTWLRRFFLLEKAPQPPMTPRTSRASQARVSATPNTGTPRVEYQDAPPETGRVIWKRESVGGLRVVPVESWFKRVTPRQRILGALGVVALVAMAMEAATRGAVSRTLPAVLHGYWTTDTERYTGVAMELRAHVMAFRMADTAHTVVIRRVVSVRTEAAARGIVYRVEYEADGGIAELRFRYVVDLTPEIVVETQPLMTWRRISRGTMLPAGYIGL